MSTRTPENTEQPAATDCSVTTLGPTHQEYTPATEICQVPELEAPTVARLEKIGLETVGDVIDVLDVKGDGALLELNGIGAQTVQGLKQALQPTPTQLSLDDIQKKLDRMARDKAVSLLADLEEAREEAKRGKTALDDSVADAKVAIEQAQAAVKAVDRKAEVQIQRAFNLLGEGEDARTVVQQIIDARDMALLDAEAKLEAVELRLAESQDAGRKELGETRELVGLLEEELDDLVTRSPVAAETVREGRQVQALAAQADALTENHHHGVSDLERLMEQLSRYATVYPVAARALVSLEHYAETWYADQLRGEIDGLVPSPSFPDELAAIVGRAEEAGVGALIAEAVEAAKARDREVLAEKGREARLYAKRLASTSRVESGDVVAHRAGRVTVYRRQNGHYKITQAYVINQGGNPGGDWIWEKDESLIGRVVSEIRSQRTYQV